MAAERSTPEFFDTPLLEDADGFAREAHQGRRRQGHADVRHSEQAARLVRQAGFGEELVAAALLHDVLEDTDVTAGELRERFGDAITDLVAALTEEDAIGDYERRKAGLRGQAVEAGPDTAAIFAAEKLASARDLNRTGVMPGPQKLRHYRESLALLRARRPELPFLDELAEELTRMGAVANAGQPAAREVSLEDGQAVLVRPIAESDAPLLAVAYERMSQESRRRRFLAAPARLTDEDLRYLTAVDGARHAALVALDPATGALIGEARHVREPGRPEAAEVATVVVDEWQGKGVATALLTELTAIARENGIVRYKAVVSADNEIVLEALAKLGGRATGESSGELEFEFDVPAAEVSDRLLGALRWAATGQLRLVGAIAGRVARLVSA
jgi:GNAT superfamily N-acetyltransferase